MTLYVDESACYLLPFLAHSWAPRRQAPSLLEQAGRAHLNGPPLRPDCSCFVNWPFVSSRAGPAVY
jgi:hypothetical protein